MAGSHVAAQSPQNPRRRFSISHLSFGSSSSSIRWSQMAEIPSPGINNLPALFATNRQVRRETIPIWYSKNRFEFVVNDCDARLVYKFYQASPWQDRFSLGSKILLKLSGAPSWRNLLDWSRAVYQVETVSVGLKALEEDLAQRQPLVGIVSAAHQVCWESRVKRETWEQCEETLNNLRRVAVYADPLWLEG